MDMALQVPTRPADTFENRVHVSPCPRHDDIREQAQRIGDGIISSSFLA